VFPEPGVLPVFNSCAIELNLHLIPGLARRFLYLNDDLFLGRDITPADYLPASGRQRFYFEPNPLSRTVASGPVHDRAYAHTAAIVDRLAGRCLLRGTSRGAYGRSGFARIVPLLLRRLPGLLRLLPAHVPQLYDRGVLCELERLLPAAFAATRAHRFRAADDLVLRVLYAFSLAERAHPELELEAVRLDWCSGDYHFVRMQGSPADAGAAIARTTALNPRFLCVNDDLDDDTRPGDPVPSLWRRYLRSRYPVPSPFERVENAMRPAGTAA